MSGELVTIGFILLVALMTLINLMVIEEKINRIERLLDLEHDERMRRERAVPGNRFLAERDTPHD